MRARRDHVHHRTRREKVPPVNVGVGCTETGPNRYATATLDFVAANAPDDWNGPPVQVGTTFLVTDHARYDGNAMPASSPCRTWRYGAHPPLSRPPTRTTGTSSTAFPTVASCVFDASTVSLAASRRLLEGCRRRARSRRGPARAARRNRHIRPALPGARGWICRPASWLAQTSPPLSSQVRRLALESARRHWGLELRLPGAGLLR